MRKVIYFLALMLVTLSASAQKIVDDFYKLLEMDLSDDYKIVKAFENCEIESLLMYEIIKKDRKAIEYLDKLSDIKPEISGNDLKNMGLPPSEKYAKIFDYVLSEKLKNPALTKDEELELVEKYEKNM